jgi:hypothetical protein
MCGVEKHVQYFYPTLERFLSCRYLFSGNVFFCKETKFIDRIYKRCLCGEDMLSGCALNGMNCKRCNKYWTHEKFKNKSMTVEINGLKLRLPH